MHDRVGPKFKGLYQTPMTLKSTIKRLLKTHLNFKISDKKKNSLF